MSEKRVKEEFLSSKKDDTGLSAPEKKKPSPIPMIIFTAVVVGLIIAIIAVLGLKNRKKDKESSGTGVDISEKVLELGDYKTFSYHKYTTDVTDEEVKKYYSTLVQMYTAYGMTAFERDDSRKGDTVKDEDAVNIDYACYIDGVALDTVSGKNYNLAIGSGDFIEGFENGLIGHTDGEKFEISVDIPESFTGAGDLAGKAAVFSVTINYFLKKIPLDEENAAKQIFGKDSVEEAYAYLKEYLINNPSQTEEQYNDLQRTTYERQVVDGTKYGDIDADIKDHYTKLHKKYEDETAKNNMTLEDFATSNFGSIEAFEASMKEDSEIVVKSTYAFMMIGKQEEITMSDEKYTELARNIAANYDFETIDSFEKDYDGIFGKGSLHDYVYATYVKEEMFSKYAEEVK